MNIEDIELLIKPNHRLTKDEFDKLIIRYVNHELPVSEWHDLVGGMHVSVDVVDDGTLVATIPPLFPMVLMGDNVLDENIRNSSIANASYTMNGNAFVDDTELHEYNIEQIDNNSYIITKFVDTYVDRFIDGNVNNVPVNNSTAQLEHDPDEY